jgi:hypothetical protein
MEFFSISNTSNEGEADMLIIRMLPKHVTVDHLDIGKIVLVVVIQCMIVDMTVPAEFVGKAVISSMYITEKNKLRSVVKGYRKCSFQYLVKSRACSNVQKIIEIVNFPKYLAVFRKISWATCLLDYGLYFIIFPSVFRLAIF